MGSFYRGVFMGCRALMAAKTSAAAAAIPKKSAAPAPPLAAAARPNTGIKKVVPVSAELGRFLGASEASRTGAVKKVWEYIKLHNLQNPANKREIRCDEKLKAIFAGKENIGFLEVAKLLSPHFTKSA